VAKGSSGEDAAPIFWDDNYVSLMPREKREFSARFESDKNHGDGLVLTIDGWNVVAASSPIAVEGER
jgi:exo-1,4-beta-D-glucosaminidase